LIIIILYNYNPTIHMPRTIIVKKQSKDLPGTAPEVATEVAPVAAAPSPVPAAAPKYSRKTKLIVVPSAIPADPPPPPKSEKELSTPITLHQQIIDEVTREYVKTFNEFEIRAHNIAQDHLKTSFDLKRSIGFIAFRK
jgi:hypothetical protein